MSFDTGAVAASEPRCDGCGVGLVAIDSFVAEEDLAEVEVVTWSCPRCGGGLETAARAPELGRSVA